MKLRNKKTGKVANVIFYSPVGNYALRLMEDADYLNVACNDKCLGVYETLAELNEEWEDYGPAEPLIKDEKIRKAVRAWLAIQGQPIVAAAITCNKDDDGFFNYCLYGYIEKARISNGKPVVNNNLTAIDFEFRSLEKMKFERHRDYTIAELCGEEEE